MKPTTEQQKLFEARNKTLSGFFLTRLNCKYQGEKADMDLFYDNVTGQLIGIQKAKTSKQELMNQLNIVRGTCKSI